MKDACPDVALLAPVPHEHLQDGAQICQREGRVAFGSRAWELFRELDRLRGHLPVDVYVYASHSNALTFDVSWHARYIGHVHSINGAHPAGSKCRPPSTFKYADDNQGYWAIFWEVEDLRELSREDRIAIKTLRGYGRRAAYGKNFVPEGPILIERP